jgi:hypothetical protein
MLLADMVGGGLRLPSVPFVCCLCGLLENLPRTLSAEKKAKAGLDFAKPCLSSLKGVQRFR